MKKFLFSCVMFVLIVLIATSCKTVNCNNEREQKLLTIEYEILDGSDCSLIGFIKDGEYYLNIDGDRHQSVIMQQIKSEKGQKGFIKTNFDFKENETILISLVDENMVTKLLDAVKEIVEGYYKLAGDAFEIAKNAPGLNKLLDKFVECGNAKISINDYFLKDNSIKEIYISDSNDNPKIKLLIYFTCR